MAKPKWLKNRKKWLVRWQVSDRNGILIHKESKTFTLKRDASDYWKWSELEKDRIRSGLKTPSESIDKAVLRWFKHNRCHTPETQGLYKYVLSTFLESLPKRVNDIKHIRSAHINDYLNDTLSSGLTPRTCNCRLTAVKSFCRWFSDRYHVENPAAKIKMYKEDPPNARFLKKEEYVQVIAAVYEPLRGRLMFLGNTGMRVSEFCNLTWSCINNDRTAVTFGGKGRKRRTVPLNQNCRDVLEMLSGNQKPNDYIFLSKNGKRLARRNVTEACNKIAKKIGIEKFGPHSIRHFFATELLLNGIDMYRVSKLLGHASVKTTEKHYAHILDEHLANITDVLL